MKAVITADIINSTKLDNNSTNLVIDNLHRLIKELKNTQFNINNSFAIKRGDSIQGEVEAKDALRIALLIKMAVNKIHLKTTENNRLINVDIRISIGIGNITSNKTINESTGEAYINSGRTLERMKKEKRKLTITSPNQELNTELNTAFKLLEVIMERWTIASTNILYHLLLQRNIVEVELAKILKVRQSSINQTKKRVGWNALDSLINRFEILMQRN